MVVAEGREEKVGKQGGNQIKQGEDASEQGEAEAKGRKTPDESSGKSEASRAKTTRKQVEKRASSGSSSGTIHCRSSSPIHPPFPITALPTFPTRRPPTPLATDDCAVPIKTRVSHCPGIK